MHHRHLDKEEGESFGMLFVAKKYWDKIKRDDKYKNQMLLFRNNFFTTLKLSA